MLRTAYNTTDRPVVTDDEGRTIGGREWGTVETTADAASAALEAGDLHLVDVPSSGDVNPRARAAADHTAEVERRAGKLDKLAKDRLVEAAIEAGLDVDPDDPPHKPALVHALASRTGVELPTSKRSSSSSDASTETEEA